MKFAFPVYPDALAECHSISKEGAVEPSALSAIAATAIVGTLLACTPVQAQTTSESIAKYREMLVDGGPAEP